MPLSQITTSRLDIGLVRKEIRNRLQSITLGYRFEAYPSIHILAQADPDQEYEYREGCERCLE